MFNSIKARLKSLKKQGKYGAGYVDTVVKVITCVVVGALLLTGIYAIANTGMTTASNKTDSLFSYEAELPGGPGGTGGGGALPDGEDSGPVEMLDKTDNYEKAHVASQNLTFRSSAPIDTFESVEVNGVTVDPSHYTLTEGSTIVTFDKEYAYSLPVGANVIDIISKDGTASADFTVTYTPGLYDEAGNMTKNWEEIKASATYAFSQPGKIIGDEENGCCAINYPWFEGHLVVSDEITEIGGLAFLGCDRLTKITLPETVTKIGYIAFAGCNSLTSINILDNVYEIADGALDAGDSLESIVVSASNDVYSSKDGVLFNKNQTTLIQYPLGKKDSSYKVPSSVSTIADTAFAECSTINSVTIPDSVTTIGGYAFGNCSSLSEVKMSKNVEYIGHGAFWCCPSLNSIRLPKSLTSVSFADAWESGFGIVDSDIGDIYYEGTETEWLAIENMSISYNKNQTTVHYNSEF